jgi:hypothetical protein
MNDDVYGPQPEQESTAFQDLGREMREAGQRLLDRDEREAAGDAPDLRSELVALLNKHSRENVSNTPDFILRDFMWHCLKAFEAGVNQRDNWYNIDPQPRPVC